LPNQNYYAFFFVILFPTVLFGQRPRTLDSLNREVNVLVYSNPELAIEKGLGLYELSNNNASFQISALLAIANGYAVLKEHDEVFKYAFKADSVAEINKNYTDQIRVLGFISGQYRRLKLGDKALSYIDQAYDLSIKHPLPDSLGYLQGNILLVKGFIQMDNLGCEYAMPYMKDAAQVFKDNYNNESINSSLAIAFNNIGDCNFEIENYEEAKANYNEAIHYAEKINAIKNIAYSRLGLANLLSKEGNHIVAIETLEEAYKYVEDVNDTGINTELLEALRQNYKVVGNDEKYNFYTKLYLEEERILLEEEKKSLNNVTKTLSSDHQEKRQIQKSKYTYVFIFCGLILLIILLLLYRKIAQKRQKIKESKDKIQESSNLD